MSFRPIFGQITILSLSFVTFRVSRFHVSHLTHETFKSDLQNTLNISKTVRVYFGVLQRHLPNFKSNYHCPFENSIIPIAAIVDSGITNYFDNYFVFKTNLIMFFTNK